MKKFIYIVHLLVIVLLVIANITVQLLYYGYDTFYSDLKVTFYVESNVVMDDTIFKLYSNRVLEITYCRARHDIRLSYNIYRDRVFKKVRIKISHKDMREIELLVDKLTQFDDDNIPDYYNIVQAMDIPYMQVLVDDKFYYGALSRTTGREETRDILMDIAVKFLESYPIQHGGYDPSRR